MGPGHRHAVTPATLFLQHGTTQTQDTLCICYARARIRSTACYQSAALMNIIDRLKEHSQQGTTLYLYPYTTATFLRWDELQPKQCELVGSS